jgi:hypothetical protein
MQVCAFVMLTACGGGGGNTSTTSNEDTTQPGTNPNASVSVDTSAITISFIHNESQSVIDNTATSAQLTKKINLTGINLNNLPDNFLLGYFTENQNFSNEISANLNQTSNSSINAVFRPSSNLTPGVYSGNLQLVACYLNPTFDDCKTHLSGSPSNSMPYKVTVFPKLYFISSPREHYANQGSARAIEGTAELGSLYGFQGDSLTEKFTYSSGGNDWISATRTGDQYRYRLNTKNLPFGNHTATMRVTSAESMQSTEIEFRIRIGANSFLDLPPATQIEVTDQTVLADLKAEYAVNVENDISLPWTATATAPWILFDKKSGLTGEKLIYRLDTAYIASMPTEARFASTGVNANITVSHNGTYTIAPFSININLQRLTSDVDANTGPALPIKTTGYPIYLSGKNLTSDTVYNVSGPSTLTILTDGTIQSPPTAAGNYTVKTKNALNLPTSSATLRFFNTVQHSYRFLPLNGHNRAFTYDQERDSLYIADKTRQQLVRFQHASGTWTQTTKTISNISDLGLSKDGKRLFISRTSGSLNRLDPSNLTVVQTMTFGLAFPEYKKLSQGLPVLGLGNDYVSVLTTPSATQSVALRQLSGITTWSSLDNNFISTSGYDYKPERGGWFANSQLPSMAYFTQALPRGFDAIDQRDYGTYAGALTLETITPTAFRLDTPIIQPFSTFDTGLTTARSGAGLLDRTSLYDGYFDRPIEALPLGYQAVGSLISADWKFIYILTYPIAAINGDMPTNLKPRLYTYSLDFDAFPNAQLTSGFTEINDYPTCRRASDSTCELNTLSATSMDGKTLFFAGDKGVVVVPDPAVSRTTLSSNSTSSGPQKSEVTKSQKLRFGKPISVFSTAVGAR